FSHGNANWKQNGGTPPGWSQGQKTGWGCTPGANGCMPPGLAKQAGNNGSVSTIQAVSTSRKTPQLTATGNNAPTTRASVPQLSTGNAATPRAATRTPT